MTIDYKIKTEQLIDSLKGVCTAYGLGNDGNEFKIITQAFLYKFLNDKFAYEIKQIEPKLADTDKWEAEIAKYSENDYEMLLMQLGGNTAKLKKEHFISTLFNRQNEPEFAKLFDDTLKDIGMDERNSGIFSVKTAGGSKVVLFEGLSQFITDLSERDNFSRAIINKLLEFSFEDLFTQKFDFFAHIFEYMIQDYNKDGGGKYAEYYTPHAVAKIMASILVDKSQKQHSKLCYDPSAGSGSLLMSLAHEVGERNCSIYSQDISQKSSSLLRLNLILNNLVSSIQNVIQGNTLTHPYHKEENGALKNLIILSQIRPLKLILSIIGTIWKRKPITNDSLQAFQKFRKKMWIKCQSICYLYSILCIHSTKRANRQLLCQQDLLRLRAVSKRKYGNR